MREKISAAIEAGLKASDEDGVIGVQDDFPGLILDGRFDLDIVADHVLRAIPTWQPIETAPKDGTSILLAVKMYDPPPLMIVGEGRWNNEAWWWANLDAGDYHAEPIEELTGRPSHWMPLPAPPE